MNEIRIRYLLQRYAEHLINKEERAELIGLINQAVDSAISDETVTLLLAEVENLPEPSLSDETARNFIRHIVDIDQVQPAAKRSDNKPLFRMAGWRRWSWAAASILLIGTGVYLYTTSRKTGRDVVNVIPTAAETILPG